MTVAELIEKLSCYEGDAQIRLAWYSYGNYNGPTDDFNLEIYQDYYEDSKGDVIATKDVVFDLGDFNS